MKTFEEWNQNRQLSEVDWRKLGRQGMMAGAMLGTGVGLGNLMTRPQTPTVAVAPDDKNGIVKKVPVQTEPHKSEVPSDLTPVTKRQFITDEPSSDSFRGHTDQSPQICPVDNCGYLSYIPVGRYEWFVRELERAGGKIDQQQKQGDIVMVWYKSPHKIKTEAKTYLVWEAASMKMHGGQGSVKAHTGFVGSSGVQAHSAGPLFPMMIRGVGNTVQAFGGEDQQGPRYPFSWGDSESHSIAYAQAEKDARTMLAAMQAGETDLTAGLDYSQDYDPVAKAITGRNPSRGKSQGFDQGALAKQVSGWVSDAAKDTERATGMSFSQMAKHWNRPNS